MYSCGSCTSAFVSRSLPVRSLRILLWAVASAPQVFEGVLDQVQVALDAAPLLHDLLNTAVGLLQLLLRRRDAGVQVGEALFGDHRADVFQALRGQGQFIRQALVALHRARQRAVHVLGGQVEVAQLVGDGAVARAHLL